jgi:hypothetical protein
MTERLLYFSFKKSLNNSTKLNKKTMRNFTPPQTASKTKKPKAFLLAMLTLMSCIITPHWGAGGLFAQTCSSLSGVINTYAPVSNIAGNVVTIGATSGASAPFAVGDYVVLIQMTGPPPVIAGSNMGKYELRLVTAATGSNITLSSISNTYSFATEKVQLVRTPNCPTATISAKVTTKVWDGTTGGVLALHGTTLTMNANIDATGTGFSQAYEPTSATSFGSGSGSGTTIGRGSNGVSVVSSEASTGVGGGGGGGTGGGGGIGGVATGPDYDIGGDGGNGGNLGGGGYTGGNPNVSPVRVAGVNGGDGKVVTIHSFFGSGGGGGGGIIGGGGGGGITGGGGGGGSGGVGNGGSPGNTDSGGGAGGGSYGGGGGAASAVSGGDDVGGAGGGGSWTGGGCASAEASSGRVNVGAGGAGNTALASVIADNQHYLNTTQPKLIMGGSGGDGTLGLNIAGGLGGGIIILEFSNIVANNFTIRSEGAKGGNGLISGAAEGQGGGGGGGGGQMSLNVNTFTNTNISISGGQGGNGGSGTYHGGVAGAGGGAGGLWLKSATTQTNTGGNSVILTGISSIGAIGGTNGLPTNNPKNSLTTGVGACGGNGLVIASAGVPAWPAVCTKPVAGSDQTLCGGRINTATLTGTNSATGTWTVQSGNPSGASLSTSVAGVATATFTATAVGNFNFIYTVDTCTDTLKVTVLTKPNAGIDQTICANSKATLNGTIPTTGTWTAKADNPTAVTLSTSVAGVATATFGTLDVGVYNFIYTAGTCSDTLKVTVNPKPNAGIDQALCGGNAATLTGTSLATGTWTAQSGNPTGASLSTSVAGVAKATFTTTAAGVFNFIYTAGGCTDTLKVTATAKPSAGIDQTVCQGSNATLRGTIPTTGTWMALSSNPIGASLGTSVAGVATSTFSSTAVGIYNFIYTAGTCSDTLKVTVVAKPNAGIDQGICSGTKATLTGTSPATGTWTAQSGNPAGATISTSLAGVATATFTAAAIGNFNFIYTAGTCTDTVKITTTAKPFAGIDQTPICVGVLPITTATLAATAISGGTWTQKAGNPAGAAITTPAAANSGVTGLAAGVYEFVWTAATCSDTVKVTIPTCVAPCPTIVQNSAADTTICAGSSVTLKADLTGITTEDIKFVYFDTYQTVGSAIYGTPSGVLGTVTNAQLTAGKTKASLTVTIPAAPASKTYHVYAILASTPTDAACRPFGHRHVITDPSKCPVVPCGSPDCLGVTMKKN